MTNPFPRPPTLARLAALATAGAGSFSLVTWWLGQWRLTTLGPDYVPMAPLTALLFMLLGFALSARLQWPDSHLAHRLCSAGALPTGLVGGLVLLQSWLGFDLPWDHWFLPAPATIGAIPVGRMSPLTALAFLLTAAALLGQCTRFPAHVSIRRGVYLLAGAGLAVGCTVAAAYVAGTPMLYGSSTVPMALLTALAFIALNAGLLLAGQVDKLLREWHQLETAADFPVESQRFTRRLILSLLVIGTLIALAGVYYLRREQAEARAAISQQLESIAALKVEQISTWRNERLGEARFLQRTPQILRDLEAFAAAPGDTGARRLQEWLGPIKGGDRYQSILVLDPQARPLLAIPAAAGPPVSPDLFARALAGTQPVFGNLERDAGDDRVHLDLLVPIRPPPAAGAAPAPTPIVVILLRLDPRHFLFPLISRWPVPSKTAESVLVQRVGDEVVFLNELQHRPGLTRRYSIREPRLPAAMGARGEFGVHEGIDYRGVTVLAVTRAIPGSPWILIAKVDLTEAYAPIQRNVWQTGFLLVLLLLAVVLAGLTLWRQRHAAFLHAALAAERERKALGERLGLVMQYANDCIFLMDETGRISEANDRAVATYGYTLAELRALPPGGLRPPSVQDDLPRQLNLIEAPGGAVFETIHQRKDGSVFPVEVSGRATQLGGRRQLLGIYRDITERRAHEREIERLNRMYFVISQVNQTIVRTKDRTTLFQNACRVLVEFGHFRIAWIGWHDPATRMLDPVAVAGDAHDYVPRIQISSDPAVPESHGPSGTAFREGRTCVCNDFFGDPTTQPWCERARPSGFQATLSLPLWQEGAIGGVLTVYAAEKDSFGPREITLLEEAAADVSFALDVLAGENRRQQAEVALRQSETRLAFFLTATPAIIYALRPEGEYATNFISPNVREVLGHEPAAFTGNPDFWRNHLHPDDAAAATRVFPGGAGRGSLIREYRFRHRDGTWRWMHDEVRQIRDDDGRLLELVGFWIDITDRKEAETALRESETLLREAQNIANLGSYELEVTTGRWRSSEVLDRVFGIDAAYERSVAGWENLIHPDDRTMMDRYFKEEVLGRQQPFDKEYRIIRQADRAERWVWGKGRLDRDAQGEVRWMRGIIQDITERKHMENALRRTEELYRLIAENTTDVIWLYDLATGRFNYMSPSIEHMVGYTREEAMARNIAGLLTPASAAEATRVLETRLTEFAASGALELNHVGLFEHVHKDGSIRIGEVVTSLLLNEAGRPRQLLGVTRDITARRQAELELQKLSRVVEQSPTSVVITDLTGAIEYVNPCFCALTGYTLDEMRGQNPRVLKSGDTPEATYVDMWQTLAAGRTWRGELRNRKKNGEPYTELAVIAPVVGPDGRATHYVAIKDDITERQRLEAAARETLQRFNTELEHQVEQRTAELAVRNREIQSLLEREQQVSEMKTRFISMTSHEFRTPMTAIMGSAELLAYHLDQLTPAKRAEIFERINTSLHRMTVMLDDVLTLNRVDAKRIEVRLTTIDLGSFLQNVIGEIRIGDHDAHPFAVHLPPANRPFVTDPNLLHHILSNLLGNAVRYSPAGAAVTVRAETDAWRLHLSVEDHGIGIPPADRARVFEPFERGSNVGPIHGTGLGLNIVKRLTELLGGHVTLRSLPGNGTRFTVALPLLNLPTP